ncbi:MAG: sugar nucleotide-binding protein, partial [Phycisphaerales bacterium]|nr:sugar nucleotide-binding protein [Phycisphaerales bacterium]
MSDAPHVVIGATGMLGRAVVAELRGRGIEPLTPTRAEVDLARPESIDALPVCDALFNCAAWTDVDGAEAHEAEATVINGEAVSRLASKCSGGFVTFGTDYVFNGRGESPYKTNASRDPINAYGRSKAAGEHLLESSSSAWLNVRTSWLYAPWAN